MDPTSSVALGITTSTLLAIAAMFLGLALIVQVIQELFKYLTSSKARIYRMVLRDFFGPWIQQLYQSGPAARFHVRAPLQFFKSRPTGVLLPLDKDQLLEALDAMAPEWIGRTLETLKAERRVQNGKPAEPEQPFQTLVANLRQEVEETRRAVEERDDRPRAESAVHSEAGRMLDFLERWKAVKDGEPADEIDAAKLIEGLYQEFLPDRLRADRDFGQLTTNFTYASNRRNLRYSFLFGLLVAIGLNFPFDALYRNAAALSPEEAIALAEEVRGIRQQVDELDSLPDMDGADEADEDAEKAVIEERIELIEDLVARIDPEPKKAGVALHLRGWERVKMIWKGEERWFELLRYFFNCLITAILISFGAPFWDRLTEALLKVQRRPASGAEAVPAKEV